MLGLAREENGTAVQVLRALGVEPGQVLRAVERAVAHGERVPAERPQLTAQAKQVIELSVDEARLFANPYFDTVHLLLGIVRAGEGTAVSVLRGLGVNLDRVRGALWAQAARTLQHTPARLNERQAARRALVDRITLDLTAEAEAGQFDPLIRVLPICARRYTLRAVYLWKMKR